MERKIIYLNDLTTKEELENLIDYVWKQDRLIPVEQLEGE